MMVIYKIIDLKSLKFYIGSAVNFKERKRIHLRDLNANKHHSIKLQRSWNKYGKDNFSFEILEILTDKNLLLVREQYWLDLLKPFGKQGFNVCKNAGNMLGFKHSIKTKKLLSNVQKTPILQYSKEGKFIKKWDSAKDASIHYNTIYNNIINGKDKNCLRVGFLWKSYIEEYPLNVLPYKKEKNKLSVSGKKVLLNNALKARETLIKTFTYNKDNTINKVIGTKQLFNNLNITRSQYYKNQSKFNNLYQITNI